MEYTACGRKRSWPNLKYQPLICVNGLRKIINPLSAELNPICHFLALLGAHHILHVSRIRVKSVMVVAFEPKPLEQEARGPYDGIV
jgi:hypothetical protein